MALMAAAFPILPGRMDDWRRWVDEMNGPRHDEFMESRRSLGVHERAFFQATPDGDLVIVTLEGEDPAGAFRQMVSRTDPFTRWFLDNVRETHGFDLAEVAAGPMPTLVADSEDGQAVAAGQASAAGTPAAAGQAPSAPAG
jgi:hypothetical protein